MKIYKKGSFESAHKLEDHFKCGKLHGHSYNWEVWIEGEPNPEEWNFIVDFYYLKEYFNQFDHSNIVLTDSCEIMTLKACKYFKEKFSNIEHIRVRIWETASSYAESEL